MENNAFNLMFIYEKITDWVKFAEAKNGAILALDCAIIFGITRTLMNVDNINMYFLVYVILSLICLATSIVISLMSFIPRLDPPWWVSFPKKTNQLNILYFGHICSHSNRSYLEQYYKVIGKNDAQFTDVDNHLSNQIVTNSKIAYIKYKQFSISVWFTISALLTPIGAYLVAKIRE